MSASGASTALRYPLAAPATDAACCTQRPSRLACCRQVLGAFSHVSEGMTVLRRLADSALASVTYGLDRKGDQERVNALAKRLEQLQQVMSLEAALSCLRCSS